MGIKKFWVENVNSENVHKKRDSIHMNYSYSRFESENDLRVCNSFDLY